MIFAGELRERTERCLKSDVIMKGRVIDDQSRLVRKEYKSLIWWLCWLAVWLYIEMCESAAWSVSYWTHYAAIIRCQVWKFALNARVVVRQEQRRDPQRHKRRSMMI